MYHEIRQDLAGLLSRSASQFNRNRDISGALGQLARVFAQQPQVRASQAVFGEQSDRFKKRRAEVVVKVLGIKFLLGRLHQAGAHVGFEFGEEDGMSGRSRQSRPLIFHAAKRRVDVRIIGLEPVAKRSPNQR